MNITPENITHLAPDEVFVYGSNCAGRHGAGAAKTAMMKFGAVYGKTGYRGQSYGISTKDHRIQTLPLDQIKDEVEMFTDFAECHNELKMLVTEIGCGLAGLTPGQMAPLFLEASKLPNVWLPQRFWHVLNNK